MIDNYHVCFNYHCWSKHVFSRVLFHSKIHWYLKSFGIGSMNALCPWSEVTKYIYWHSDVTRKGVFRCLTLLPLYFFFFIIHFYLINHYGLNKYELYFILEMKRNIYSFYNDVFLLFIMFVINFPRKYFYTLGLIT